MLKGLGLSVPDIKKVGKANADQDDGAIGLRPRPPFSDPLNHGDNNKIKETIQRIEDLYAGLRGLKTRDEILKQFGKILHAIQDLYAHTNYVEIMDAKRGGNSVAGDIPLWPFVDGEGKPYVPDDVISGEYKWPNDDADSPSHKDLNKDDKDSKAGKVPYGPGTTGFDLAKDLAERATKEAMDRFRESLTDGQKEMFPGLDDPAAK